TFKAPLLEDRLNVLPEIDVAIVPPGWDATDTTQKQSQRNINPTTAVRHKQAPFSSGGAADRTGPESISLQSIKRVLMCQRRQMPGRLGLGQARPPGSVISSDRSSSSSSSRNGLCSGLSSFFRRTARRRHDPNRKQSVR